MAEASDLSFRDAQRLTLSALAELYSTLHTHVDMDQGMKDCVEKINDKVDTLTVDINSLRCQVNETNNNPLVTLGKHLKAHPKLGILYMIVTMILVTWLPYVNLIRLLLLWVGVPTAIVDIVTPSIGGP